MHKAKLSIIILLLCACFKGVASDTLKISLNQADSMFLADSYYLLASSMNIEARRAQILQAKLYPNPIFTADINAYDPQNGRVFHIGNSGQKGFQFEQLILLGGKRKAQIELAKTNAQIAELEFQNLIRQLRFQLHTSLYNINQQASLLQKYNKQMSMLDTIISAYDNQVKKGNLPLKDIVRLKGAYLNLNSDRAEVFKIFFDELAKVQSILQTNKIVMPEITEENFISSQQIHNLEDLNEHALKNRPDYLLVLQDKVLAQQYLKLNKKLAVPDVVLFTSYDQRGGAFQNQVNAGVSIPLPLWNRNQGNIKTSEYEVKQKEFDIEAYKNQVLAEVNSFYRMHVQTVNEYAHSIQLYNLDFETTLKGMSDNFKRGNVSLIEFVDFFEGYNNALAEIARLKIQLAVSAEQLILSTGK